MNKYGLVATGLSTLLLGGCGLHHARVRSVNLSETGTYVVATPGALTIARQSASSSRTCTLRTGGPARGERGKRHDGPRARADGAGGRAGGAGASLDVLLFRLCEARANNDITAAQYASGVQTILKTMSKMAEHRAPPPGPGMPGRWNAHGPGAMNWNKRDHDDCGGKRECHEGGTPEAHPGPQRQPEHGPAHKGDQRRKHR